MVQPLLGLDELWLWASTSVEGFPIAIALLAFQAISLVFTT